MKQVEQVIKLVRDSIQSGLAKTETSSSLNVICVRYLIGKDGDKMQYVAYKEGFEPQEVSIARRLLLGNLNLSLLENDGLVSQEMLALLKTIDGLRVDAGFRRPDDVDLAMCETLKRLYTKEVTIFQNNIHITTDEMMDMLLHSKEPNTEEKNLALMAGLGDYKAILELDRIGAYYPVAKVTVPDGFSTSHTLNTLVAIGQRGVDHLVEHGEVKMFERPGVNPFESISGSHVMRMDGKDYHLDRGIIREMEGFKGARELRRPTPPTSGLSL